MPIELPKGLPFSVDTWIPASMQKRHYFLTHAHGDHFAGITSHFSYPIYSTLLTKQLLFHYYPQMDESLFVYIEAGESRIVKDPDGDFCISAFDANHCPGAVMFLFEGRFGNILHTGDSRLTPDCLLNLPEKYIGKRKKPPKCQLDFVFLDCTFGKCYLPMPSKHLAIRQVVNCIWKHPKAPIVYLTCDLLGQEEILVNVSQIFGSKIYIDKTKTPRRFEALALVAPDILSEDASCRFHLFDAFPNLQERAAAKIAEAQAKLQPEPLIIRPSTQWYAHDGEFSDCSYQQKPRIDKAIKDHFGIWHVCYSIHSSKEELEWALQLLSPKRVASTTPGCWSMDLDYVKNHCFSTQVTSSDPLWKILDISVTTSQNVTIEGVNCSVVDDLNQSLDESQLKAVSIFRGSNVISKNSSPPTNKTSFTLFGRARLGMHSFSPRPACKKVTSTEDNTTDHSITNGQEEKEGNSLSEMSTSNLTSAAESSSETKITVIVSEEQHENQSVAPKRAYSPIGSSKFFSNSLRRLYRSRNVPVPEPLPSLVELMKSNKRAKRIFNL